MDLISIIDAFHNSNGKIYKAELDNFMDYLVNVRHWQGDDAVINGLRTDHILECLKYNIDNGTYNLQSIAKKHCTAISGFFIFAISGGLIHNSDFYDELVAKSRNTKSFWHQVNTFIAEHEDLEEPEGGSAFSNKEIRDYIHTSNAFFNEKPDKTKIAQMAAHLCIRLMILTGIKYNVAYKLPYKAVTADAVTINSYTIVLPPTLRQQFQYYKSIVEGTDFPEAFKLPVPEYLFLQNDGSPWGSKTTSGPLSYEIKKAFNITSTTGLSKAGICNLIEADFSDSVISEITGAQKSYIQGCIREKSYVEKNKYVNTRIVRTEFYYDL